MTGSVVVVLQDGVYANNSSLLGATTIDDQVSYIVPLGWDLTITTVSAMSGTTSGGRDSSPDNPPPKTSPDCQLGARARESHQSGDGNCSFFGPALPWVGVVPLPTVPLPLSRVEDVWAAQYPPRDPTLNGYIEPQPGWQGGVRPDTIRMPVELVGVTVAVAQSTLAVIASSLTVPFTTQWVSVDPWSKSLLKHTNSFAWLGMSMKHAPSGMVADLGLLHVAGFSDVRIVGSVFEDCGLRADDSTNTGCIRLTRDTQTQQSASLSANVWLQEAPGLSVANSSALQSIPRSASLSTQHIVLYNSRCCGQTANSSSTVVSGSCLTVVQPETQQHSQASAFCTAIYIYSASVAVHTELLRRKSIELPLKGQLQFDWLPLPRPFQINITMSIMERLHSHRNGAGVNVEVLVGSVACPSWDTMAPTGTLPDAVAKMATAESGWSLSAVESAWNEATRRRASDLYTLVSALHGVDVKIVLQDSIMHTLSSVGNGGAVAIMEPESPSSTAAKRLLLLYHEWLWGAESVDHCVAPLSARGLVGTSQWPHS